MSGTNLTALIDLRHIKMRAVDDLAEVDWESYPDHSGEEGVEVGRSRRRLSAYYARQTGCAWDDDLVRFM